MGYIVFNGRVVVVVGEIGIGVRSVLSYLPPLANTIVIGGSCYIFWGRGKFLGVEWGFYLYLGSSFSRDRSDSLLVKLVQGSALFFP